MQLDVQLEGMSARTHSAQHWKGFGGAQNCPTRTPLDYVALPSELLLNFSALQDWVIALSELLTLAGSNGHLC